MTRVLVVGATGMLGSMTVDVLAGDADIELQATTRDASLAEELRKRHANVRARVFDAEADDTPVMDGFAWVINCVGLIKPYIRDNQSTDVRRALALNTMFPHRLADEAERVGARVIQIATDCVFSGRTGPSTEETAHDATDVYGKTKSLGEVNSTAMLHLRCSIIGPERKGRRSLLSWFLDQPRDGAVSGFTNHLWNGVTTLHFARICQAFIHGKVSASGVQHIVAGDDLSKHDMLHAFAEAYGRRDIRIAATEAKDAIDRRLRTIRPELNVAIWRAAGYDSPPTVGAMIAEMHAWAS